MGGVAELAPYVAEGLYINKSFRIQYYGVVFRCTEGLCVVVIYYKCRSVILKIDSVHVLGGDGVE